MGPKQKGGGSKSRGNATEEVEETLQAVVRSSRWARWEASYLFAAFVLAPDRKIYGC
jgi:hypothetical protein